MQIHIVRHYDHSPEKVWRALTDPAVIPRWTATGRGGTPVGFEPVAGNHFKYVAKPTPGWNGVVECEVLEAKAFELLRYTWRGDERGAVTVVTNLLEREGAGTRFTWDHTGFSG